MAITNVECDTQVDFTSKKAFRQVSIFINRKRLLNAFVFRNIAQREVLFYKFVQQPPMMLRPINQVSNDQELSKFPQRSKSSIVRYRGTKLLFQFEDPIMAIPISWRAPQAFKPKIAEGHQWNEIDMTDGGRNLDDARVCQLPYSERKTNWIYRRAPRKDGKSDISYIHLQTDKQFRSLIKVHDFVMNGRFPDKKFQALYNIREVPLRGEIFIQRIPVGYYNLNKREIDRRHVQPETTHRKNSNDNDLMTTYWYPGSKKRKRQQDYNTFHDWGANGREMNINGETHLIFVLYDFEPK